MKRTVPGRKSALLLALLLMPALATAAGAKSKIAVVDMSKAVTECKRCKRQIKGLEERRNKLQDDIDALGKKIRQIQSELRTGAALLSPSAKQRKRMEYQSLVREYRLRAQSAQREISEAQRIALDPIVKQMRAVAKDLAQKRGYDLVLTKGALFFNVGAVDITKDLIAKFDKKFP